MILPPPLPTAKKIDRASIWQLIFAIACLCFTLFVLLVMVALSALSHNTDYLPFSVNLNKGTYVQFFLVVMVLITIPSLVLSIRRLRGHESSQIHLTNKSLIFVAAALILWGGLVYLGTWQDAWHLNSWILTALNFAILLLAAAAVLTLGLRNLSIGSKQRFWAMINVSIFITPEVAMLLELIVLVFGVLIVQAWGANDPAVAQFINALKSGNLNSDQDISNLMPLLTALFSTPGAYLLIFGFLSLLIPLIEETLKPLGVWFIAGKHLTPAEGFGAGLLCGATFGFLESYFYLNSATSDVWLTMALFRSGTCLLHMLTAGIIGWALAASWIDQKYLRVAGAFLGMVAVHGSWNFLSVLFGINTLPVTLDATPFGSLAGIALWLLAGLILVILLGIVFINWKLQKQFNPPSLPDFPVTMDRPVE